MKILDGGRDITAKRKKKIKARETRMFRIKKQRQAEGCSKGRAGQRQTVKPVSRGENKNKGGALPGGQEKTTLSGYIPKKQKKVCFRLAVSNVISTVVCPIRVLH